MFLLQKGLTISFHIDHCFIKKERIQSYEVLDMSWLEMSDHIPVVLEIKEEGGIR